MKALINTQPKEAPDWKSRGLEIEKIWQTIQGEGPNAGCPAVFIRLSGCNLQCPLCDTIYTKVRKRMLPPQIVDEVTACQKFVETRLVVITGGEPFRQHLTVPVRALLNAGYEVQIETNGTYFQVGFPYEKVEIVCSPKTIKLHPDLDDTVVDAYKYVIDFDHVDPDDGLPTRVLGYDIKPARPPKGFRGETYVQPQDEKDAEKNKKNLAAAASVCMAFGYRLSVQSHKLAELE